MIKYFLKYLHCSQKNSALCYVHQCKIQYLTLKSAHVIFLALWALANFELFGLLCHLHNTNLLTLYCSEFLYFIYKAVPLVTFKYIYLVFICGWVKRFVNSDRALLCILQKMEICTKQASVME